MVKNFLLKLVAVCLTVIICILPLAACSNKAGEQSSSSNSSSSSSSRKTTAPKPAYREDLPVIGNPSKDYGRMLEIISAEGKANYRIVCDIGNNTAQTAAAALKSKFDEAGVTEMRVVADRATLEINESEIILGDVYRNLYNPQVLPEMSLLDKGDYFIRVVGKTVFIIADDQYLYDACDAFFALWEQGKSMTLPSDFAYVYNADKRIESLKVSGADVQDYSIVYEADDTLQIKAAKELQKRIYNCCGEFLTLSNKPVKGRSISFTVSDSAKSFTLSISGKNIEIVSSAVIGLSRGVRDFAEEMLVKTEGVELNDGYKYERDYGEFVTYEEYGAKGDGKTDDIDAIAAAHAAATRSGKSVLANEGAVYYIGGRAKTAVINTDTDWSTAEFIFDDTDVVSRGSPVFRVPQYISGKEIDASGLKSLKKGAENIGFSLPSDVMLILTDKNVKQFIRKGINENTGSNMEDIILVSKNGDIDSSTPVLWDFETITSIRVIEIPEDTLTIRGGIITTIVNEKSSGGYYSRGIQINRSRTAVEDTVHYLDREERSGSPYHGMINVSSVYDFTMRNCAMAGHKISYHGSYDITFADSTHIRVENCSQTNDIDDKSRWGIFASNNCKNMVLNNCSFSRFDAHRGVCNVTLNNCEFGHQGINLIGHGRAVIENTRVKSAAFIELRIDYGSTFDGDVVIRNCIFEPTGNGSITLVNGENTGDWNFGYTCHLMNSLTVEGLEIKGATRNQLYLLANMTPGWDGDLTKLEYAPVVPKRVSVSGISGEKDVTVYLSANLDMYKDTDYKYN